MSSWCFLGGADNSETLAAGVSSESLQAAAALGISVTKWGSPVWRDWVGRNP